MKKITAVTVFCYLLIILEGRLFAQNPIIEEMFWDEDKRELSYTLSSDATVKIRAGRVAGPVYETLVNLEERKAGKHHQNWSAKDSQGSIDFTKFGQLHFCVDPQPKPEKDLELLVDSLSAEIFSLNVDLKEADKEKFAKNGFEVRTFIDGNLVKVDNGHEFPYMLNLDLNTFDVGEHLLSINLWPLPQRSQVAYKNMVISCKKKESFASLAFCQRVDGYWQIYTADLNGVGVLQLTKSLIDKSDPAFSPDGKRIAYANNRGELWIFDRENKQERQIILPVNCAQPQFSPDGKNVVFISHQDLYHGDTELWTVDIQNGELRKIINRPWLQYNPVFSPDGNNIIFVDGPELYGQEIRKINLKAKDVTQLTDNGPYDYDFQPCFSSDGEKIFYSSNQDGNYDIWVMDKFGQNPRNLTNHPADDKAPEVTGDGEALYFLSDRSGNVQIWRMGIDSTSPEQVTKAKTDLRCLSLYKVK